MKLITFLVVFVFCFLTVWSNDIIPQSGKTYWWNDTVFYEIFVRSFADSDGDGIGDLQGLISKLDYLNDGNPETFSDLGISGIWLMPVCQSPSYHGYDVTDYQHIEEDYGTNADFQLLMDECHRRGIKVIVDFVMNHCSSQHPWFIKAKASDAYFKRWFRWKHNKPSYLGPWNQPVWHEANGEYYFGLFWGGMPDLNYENKAVRKEMKDIAKFWLSEMKVDGFRCDAVKHIYEDGAVMENVPETFTWWREFHDFYKGINPDAMTVGEAWDSSDIVVKYLDNRFDFCFEFDLANTIISAVNNADADLLKYKLAEINEIYPYLQYGTFLTNHDQNRVLNQLAFNVEKAKFAASILLTLPGIPFIYYGEEIGMTGAKPDPDIRTPMQWNSTEFAGFSSAEPWHSVNDNYSEYNMEDQQKDENSLWRVYRKMITLRTEHPALRRGTTQILNCDRDDILVLLRIYQNDVVILIYNFSNDLSDLLLPSQPTGLVEADYNILTEPAAAKITRLQIDFEGRWQDQIKLQVPDKNALKVYLLQKRIIMED
ncbi:MAG: alpha-amylase [Candidatus Cloacimonetes bacterium]|nr:alpha-amylase [Candidatus Cloacimonadota bacterium]MCF7814370.1 alpha-amylase [Candidatus Cloacimonadota bacterium]MCF7884387.1 alpha-amylase [Candidatus Cloacimonadota bacterium]